jgi:hypothetical protein
MTALVPPPVHGERLSRSEFERRYEAHPEIFRAELLEGVVFIHPGRRTLAHGCVVADVVGWVVSYTGFTAGCDAGLRASTRVGTDSEVQPDVSAGILGSCGGRLCGPEDDYRPEPAEMLIEVVDRFDHPTLPAKQRLYAVAGVREFMIVTYPDRAIEWLVLDGGEYRPLARDAAGLIRSEVFPGLWLDVPAFVRNDMLHVIAVLQRGRQSPEYFRFVADLQARLTS